MAQVKIFGRDIHLKMNRKRLSEATYTSVMEALKYPKEKKFHRFISLKNRVLLIKRAKKLSLLVVKN